MESQKDKEDRSIGRFAQEAWDVWEKAGWLEGLEKEFGELSQRERVIFRDAWILGFAQSIDFGRAMAQGMAKKN